MKAEIKNQKTPDTMKKLIMLFISTAIFAFCSRNETKSKSPVVLVHGAWQADYVWEETRAGLQAAGHRVNVVALPAHGTDTTPAHQVSFKAYVEQVKAAINHYNEPVILVGHSLGGAIITQAASELPGKVSKLVYVAGFIPVSGKSVLDYSQMDSTTLLGPVLRLSEDHTLAGLDNPAVNLPRVFIQDGTDAQKQFLVERYKAEPTIPLGTPLNYTRADYEAAGKKYYILTTEDKAISPWFQQKMAAEAGVKRIYKINAGHSPFISRPNELLAIFKKIAGN